MTGVAHYEIAEGEHYEKYLQLFVGIKGIAFCTYGCIMKWENMGTLWCDLACRKTQALEH